MNTRIDQELKYRFNNLRQDEKQPGLDFDLTLLELYGVQSNEDKQTFGCVENGITWRNLSINGRFRSGESKHELPDVQSKAIKA